MDRTDILKILALSDGFTDGYAVLAMIMSLNVSLDDLTAFAVEHKIASSLAARVMVIEAVLTRAAAPVIDPRWDKQRVTLVTHYTSTSGNPTWKATLEGGQTLYIRQENKQEWFDAGYTALQAMSLNHVWDADITVYTMPGEKNFLDCKHIEPGGTLDEPVPDDDELLHISHGVAEEARRWLKEGLYVLDTETTGLEDDDQVIQLAIVDQNGTVLVNTLVHTTHPISKKATAVHGLTAANLVNAPTITEIKIGDQSLLTWLLEHEDQIVTYNADFDARLLGQSLFGPTYTAKIDFKRCAMTLYARQNGEWDDRKDDYRWVSLVNACDIEDLPAPNHSACGDATATLALIKHLARGMRLPF